MLHSFTSQNYNSPKTLTSHESCLRESLTEYSPLPNPRLLVPWTISYPGNWSAKARPSELQNQQKSTYYVWRALSFHDISWHTHMLYAKMVGHWAPRLQYGSDYNLKTSNHWVYDCSFFAQARFTYYLSATIQYYRREQISSEHWIVQVGQRNTAI